MDSLSLFGPVRAGRDTGAFQATLRQADDRPGGFARPGSPFDRRGGGDAGRIDVAALLARGRVRA